jgi:hypothetical protein
MSISLTGSGVDRSIAVGNNNIITIDNTDHYAINSTTALTLPKGTTGERPTVSEGKLRYSTTNTSIEVSTATNWKTIGALDGSSSSFAAPSAVYLRDVAGIQTNGTYWINVGGTPTQIYCNFTTAGGGWMSFASAPGSGSWGSHSTGNQVSWVGLSYTLGTYSSAGSIGNYWRNYSAQSVSEILFLTGNGTFWVRMRLDQIVGGLNAYTTNVQTSANFPNNQYSANTSVYVMHRNGQPEDPWINTGNVHGANDGTLASGDYMFWGENGGGTGTSHIEFKNANAGIIAFVR